MTNQEYNLTIMDIDWEDGQEYMMQIGCDDPFKVVVFKNELFQSKMDKRFKNS